MKEEKSEKDWVNRLIAFFKALPGRRADAKKKQYSGWTQTEEAYQKEQSEWLESVRRRKEAKQQEHTDAD